MTTSDPLSRSPMAEQAAQLLFKRMKVQHCWRDMLVLSWLSQLRTYTSVQITVKDGRELIGDFQCMDNYGNVILANAVEEAVVERRQGWQYRSNIGQMQKGYSASAGLVLTGVRLCGKKGIWVLCWCLLSSASVVNFR